MAEPLDDALTPGDAPDSPEISATAILEEPAVATGGLSFYDGPAIDIAAELRTSYLGYAMSTIVSRALPDVRDGLKPVQRRILYAMRELGLSPNSRHLKSAKVVGECFVAGTRVATPDGLRRIEDLQVGDQVFTQTGVRPVTEAYILPAQPLLDVELGSGRNVFCTPGQQFKVLTDELATVWKRADELTPGDVIVTRGGTSLEIETSDPKLEARSAFRDGAMMCPDVLPGGKPRFTPIVPEPLYGATSAAVLSFVDGFVAAQKVDRRPAQVPAPECVIFSASRPFLNDLSTLLFAHGRRALISVSDKIGGVIEYALTLKPSSHADMAPDVVKAIRPTMSEITYDIQVDVEHEFIGNGMVVHNCMGNFHPHGDQALYGTMVRMAQPFSLRYPMVDGQGNFGCFTGDTKIKLLDGTEKSFAELAALPEGETFSVYSVDKHGRIVVGEGHRSRITRHGAALVRVTLDNGAKIRCTPDHRFLLRTGEYKEAQHLTSEDSLMAGYFDTAPVKTGLNDYLRVQQPITGEWEFVHWLADEYNAQRGSVAPTKGAFVRHHKNFNRFDNNPSNIERMGFLEHLHVHAEHLAALWQDESFREAQRDGVAKYYNDNPQVRESRRKRMTVQNSDPAFRAANGKRVAASLKAKYADDPDARAAISKRMKDLWADDEYRVKMSEALRGIEKKPLTSAQKAEVARFVGEKSRAMWQDDAKREEITSAIVAAMASPELRERLRENARALWQDPAYRAKYSPTHHADMAATLWSIPETRELHREKIAGQWQDVAFQTAQREGVRKSNARRLAANPNQMHEIAQCSAKVLKEKWQDDSYRKQVMRSRVSRYVSGLISQHGADSVTPEVYERERNGGWIPRLPNALSYFTDFDEIVAAAQTYNHRIASVEAIAATADVYDITVNEHHNFLLADGVFVHNSVDDDPPAAMRYTEARLTAVAMEMMEDIEKDTVNFVPTYDNERREPSVLPGKFPYLICNGGSGIAVGMATNAPPHNLREVCDGCAFLLEHPEATIEQLMTYIPGPDFPTAGLILGSKGIKAAYHTGRGQVTMQAKTTIEPMDGGKSVIVISELPYQVIKKKLEEQIGDLVKEKKIDGITAVRDFSDKSGMRLVVELRRDVMPQKILNYLLKHTPLRLNFGVMMISLTEGGISPKTLSLKTILQEYLDHRRDIITRRTKFELARAKARAHILEGLQIAVQFLDEVIAIIRGSNSTEQARTRLIERFSFSGLQAEAILNMQLRQLTSLEQDKIEGEFKDLLKEIARFEDILMDPRRVNAMIKVDLKYLKDKFGDDRRTRIIPTEAEEINIEDLIAEEEMLITITRDGYIKRLEYATFRSQKRGGRGVTAGKTREEDNFEHLFRASTHDYILFFTDRGRVYRLKAFEVPQASRQAMGTAVINLIQIQPDEKITATVPIRDFRTAEGFLLMVTECGEIKRTAVAEYANLRANGLVTFDLEGDDALKWVKHTPGTAEVILTTERGMAIRFPEDRVPTRGRAAGGVRGITLSGPGDRVVAADVVIGDADAQELLVISELGLGKRTPLAAYRSQGRGGKGLITMNLSGERTGKCLVVAAVVSKESEPNLRLMIVTENGVMIRMKAEEIKTTAGRSTSGVRLINLSEGDRVKTAEMIDVAKASEDAEEG